MARHWIEKCRMEITHRLIADGLLTNNKFIIGGDTALPTIQDQIELEKRMVAYGVTRYRNSVQNAEEHGRAADTQYAQKLMQEFIEPVAKTITEFTGVIGPGVKAKYRSLLSTVEPNTAAYLGLRALFNHFTKDEPLATLATHIGTLIEDEAKFRVFSDKHGDYYDSIIRDFKNKGTKNYRHMHRVLTFKANENNLKWNSWTQAEKASVGIKVIDCILQSTDLIEKKTIRKKRKLHAIVVPTPSALTWVQQYTAYAEMLNPDRVPCIIPPDPWTALDQGGYYTPQVRQRTQLVKTRSKEHIKLFAGDISNITSAVNVLQRVSWKINIEVLEVLKQAWKQSLPVGLPQSEPFTIPQCPVEKTIKKENMTPEQRARFEDWKAEARMVHTMEKERVSKCFQVIRVLRTANEYKRYGKFWYVYQCDFRGRIYTTVSGLSPQGPDFSKALLQFAEGKVLGERGAYWLKVHGANTFGKDKDSYENRVAWVDKNANAICRIAEDPLRYKNIWGAADKPWQFIAFCFEYARYRKEGNGMVSSLPIALDGSCNGLQNFSAMLKDSVGGRATNLVPSNVPSDIYSEVAKVCTLKLRGMDHDLAKVWLTLADLSKEKSLPRGIAKKPVMTLPYGSTQQSCRESIYNFIAEECSTYFAKDLWFKLSVFLTPVLWASISEVVIAATKAMAWIQQCASIVTKAGKPLVWWTPLGFPVYQDRKKVFVQQIHTELCGHFRLRLATDTTELDVHKQKLGSSPNFVHSMDACHLMMTLHHAFAAGVRSFACIHDDYGTHAADTDALQGAIRDAFIQLYGENNPLLDFKVTLESQYGLELPELPPVGDLNINEIKDSRYFFG